MKLYENMSWPIETTESFKQNEHSAWYSGEPDILANFYYSNRLANSLNLSYINHNINTFWSRQIKNHANFYMHVPIANDISETSAAFLFSKAPIIRFKSSTESMFDQQQKLDSMLTSSGIYAKILEGAEVASALGGVFFKISWDTELSEDPIPVVIQADQAFPTFKHGILTELTIVYDVAENGSTVYRLAETINKNAITSTLYQGTSSNLGKIVPLTECEATESLKEVVNTKGIMTAFYVPNMLPNRLKRTSSLGRSDYHGNESLMDALDEVFSAWMLDIQISRGKVHVPSGYIKSLQDGTSKFNVDTSYYEEMEVDPTTMSKSLEATQFAIRSTEFEKTCLNLLDRIITSAGYSPQSFGLNIAGRAESGTALNVRERKSFATTNKKQAYWEKPLKAIVRSMCEVKNAFIKNTFTCDLDVNVEFVDSVDNNLGEVSATVKTLSDAKAISTDTKIRMVHPEWTDQQVMEEIERINNDSNVGTPMDIPDDITQMTFNQNKSEINDNIENQEDEEL